MKFFEPNEKRNTIAAYSFFVAIFCVICVIIGINIGNIVSALGFIFDVIKPILYGLIISFLMHPIVHFIEYDILGNRKEKKIGFRHFISVIIAYIVVIALIVIFVLTAIPQIVNTYEIFVDSFFEYIEEFRNDTADFINSRSRHEAIYIFHDVTPDLKSGVEEELFSVTLRNFDGASYGAGSSSGIQEVIEIFDDVLTSIGDIISSSLPNLVSSASTFFSEAANIVIGLFVSLYILLGERKHAKRLDFLLKGWLPKKMYVNVRWIMDKCKNIFRDYIAVRLLDGIIIGLLTFICLFAFQIPNDYEVLLAVIMGVSSFFPFVGTPIGMGVGTLILLLIDIKYAILYLIVTAVISILDSRFIEPLISTGRAEHTLPPIWVFTAIIVMGGLFGIVGILVGIPIFAFIYAVMKEYSGKRLRAKELSDDTRDYFVVETGKTIDDPDSDVIDMRNYYDERRETESEIADNARKQFSKIKGVFKRKDKSDSDEPDDKTE